MKNKYSIKYLCLWLLFLIVSYPGLAQQTAFMGTLTDSKGNPVADAIVSIKGEPTAKVFTDANGKFNITAEPGQILEVSAWGNRYKSVVLGATQVDLIIDSNNDLIPIGYGLNQSRQEISSAIGFIKSDELSKSSVYNPLNALYGKVPGLTVLQNGGTSWDNTPDIYIRGVETFGIGDFNNTNVLVLIDGFERRLSSLSLSEIESVSVLKDAAALALYGLRGANGVLLINTKKGYGKDLSVDVSYEHGFTKAFRLPEFVNAYGYAQAVNQAAVNEGLTPVYSQPELSRFQNGSSPYLYPNVNWLNEGLRDYGSTNLLNVSFQQATNAVRYFGTVNFYDEEGLFDPVDMNEGYTTQASNYKINMRTNVEVDLTKSTKMIARIAGNIGQSSRPATSNNADDIFSLLYSTPAAAYPVRTSNKEWGGSPSFPRNPVAEIEGIGYTQRGQNELMVDVLLDQDLNFLLKGLSGGFGISTDNSYEYQDVRSKQYQYEDVVPMLDEAGSVVDEIGTIYGTNTTLAFSTSVPYQYRRVSGLGNLKYNTSWGNGNLLNSTILFQAEQLILTGRHNTYRHMLAAGKFGYSKLDKYLVDLTLSYNGTNILPKDKRWGFFPALSLGWVMSNEDWLAGNSTVDFLKLRASVGMTGNDQVIQNIAISPFISSGNYRFGANNTSNGGMKEGRLASNPLTFETSYKSNFGIDATMFGMLDLNLDFFYNLRKGILVETQGSISKAIGVELPYSSKGEVKNMGMDLGLNLHKRTGDFTYHVGGNVSFAKNEILEMLEEYKPNDYLKRTGQSIGQAFGLEAIGFFRDAADIAASPAHTFSIVGPGDIKYKDQNGDQIINEYDEVPINYSTKNPEWYFAGSLGAEFKGLGFDALFQGVANMTVYLNTPSIFWPLRGNNNVSTYSENSWTPATASTAALPRLSTGENANNFRPNTIWYSDASYLKLRSLEVYYKLPKQVVNKAKLDAVTLYLRGMNLLSFDNIEVVDPEAIGLTYPTLTTYNIGIKIGF